MSKLPLEGIRVIELTTGAAGPTVARVLCEFGAEVIRCETRLRGDGHRGEDPKLWNKKPDFMKLQRGKKSFTVNMQTAKGRELVRELVKKSDVLVENFGLGILEKWGLNWPDLKEINPQMILIRVKGMGCSGPHAADLTYGPNVGNTMATTYLWNYPGATTATAEPRTQHPDFMGGVTGAFGVVLALIERKKTGRGQWIDSAQQEIGASLLGPQISGIHRQQARAETGRQSQLDRRALRTRTNAKATTAGASSRFTTKTSGNASPLCWKNPGLKADAKFRHPLAARAPQRRTGQMGDQLDPAARSLRSHGDWSKASTSAPPSCRTSKINSRTTSNTPPPVFWSI